MSKHEKQPNKMWLRHASKIADKIETKGKDYKKLSDEELLTKTDEFKDELKKGKSLNSILPDAFAAVREASIRTVDMYPFRVQLYGGIALHEGKVAELKTGEGKTLVAVLPAYLNALTGKGVHIVTVNDYLADRDAHWMGKIYEALGLSVGCITSKTSQVLRKEAYDCDVTYITNTELGFDYLRDNMAQNKDHVVQRGHNFAIIDEADSILIDEARTPLIIAGEGTDSSKIYLACDALAKKLAKGEQSKEFNKVDALMDNAPEETGDFIVDEKKKNVTLTKEGVKKVEEYFGIDNYSDPENFAIQHGMDLALKAIYVMKKDHDYIVKNGTVQIVDAFTGRVLDGRRYSDGLHQAIEAKEGVEIQQENRTVATTTYQHFFYKYNKIAGMTGTAYTERKEFKSTYGLKTVVIPTNEPMIREDYPDKIFITKNGKYKGILNEVIKTHETGQPILVGTASVKVSEELSDLFTKNKIKHNVLNAKQDAKEAEVIAQAGHFGTVTIATNMAGRGTDIIPDDKAIEAGGLKVIGTERHDAERIDNQLRGRSGRQGNPGESIFYLSTEDDLVRLFAKDRFKKLISSGLYEPDEEVDNKIFKKAVIRAQKTVEDNHFDQRKNVLDYDRVNDRQRELVYAERRKILNGEDISNDVKTCFSKFVDDLIDSYKGKKINRQEIINEFNQIVGTDYSVDFLKKYNKRKCKKVLKEALNKEYKQKVESVITNIRDIERYVVLSCIDVAWTEQLSALEYLRQDIWYLGYAQIDSKSGYAKEAFELYDRMRSQIYASVVGTLFHLDLVVNNNREKQSQGGVA